jgi:hypothetical protein
VSRNTAGEVADSTPEKVATWRSARLHIPILLFVIAGVLALIQIPPHAPVLITGSCCPAVREIEVLHEEWQRAVALSVAATVSALTTAVLLYRRRVSIALLVGALATITGIFVTGDQTLRIGLGILSLHLSVAPFAALGWVWIFLVYLRLKLAENNF